MELDLLCIQTDCQQPWCSESNMNNRNATSAQIQGTILAIEWCQSLHPAIVTNQSYIKFQLRKPMKPKNITIIVWSINTMSMACLPLCFLTSHISVIHTAIFHVSFLVCNSDIRNNKHPKLNKEIHTQKYFSIKFSSMHKIQQKFREHYKS